MRIAIVNDLNIAVEILRRVVQSVPDHEIAWVARDGREAVEKCAADVPDIILMDLIMPVMDGVEATRRIMQSSPCPILVVTATVEGNLSKVFDAMGCGALDAVATPGIGAGGKFEGRDSLLDKIDTIRRLTARRPQAHAGPSGGSAVRHSTGPVPPLVVVGASTGGPKALADIFSALHGRFRAAVAVVQHVDVRFSRGLAEWLADHTHMRVHLIENGLPITPGEIVIAGTNDHLVMRPDCRLYYTDTPRETPYRPSVDVFFNSVVENWPEPSTAMLLTGMGSDGAQGLKRLRDCGWHTIAQDRGSSVVYGMPKAAAELKAAVDILSLEKITQKLETLYAH